MGQGRGRVHSLVRQQVANSPVSPTTEAGLTRALRGAVGLTEGHGIADSTWFIGNQQRASSYVSLFRAEGLLIPRDEKGIFGIKRSMRTPDSVPQMFKHIMPKGVGLI